MILGGSSIVTRRLGFRDAKMGFSSSFLTEPFLFVVVGQGFPPRGGVVSLGLSTRGTSS